MMPKIINRNPRNPLTGFMDEKNKKPLIERKGDWSCPKCRNLNFAFRASCNRCQLTKAEADMIKQYNMPSQNDNPIQPNNFMSQNNNSNHINIFNTYYNLQNSTNMNNFSMNNNQRMMPNKQNMMSYMQNGFKFEKPLMGTNPNFANMNSNEDEYELEQEEEEKEIAEGEGAF